MTKRRPMHGTQARQRMWQSMRVLRKFTAAEIVATAEVGASNASKYIRSLVRTGYLRVVTPKQEGVTGGHAAYLLVRNSGPYAPRIGKQDVLDPNTDPGAAKVETVTIPRADYERALSCVRACAGMLEPEAEVQELRQRAEELCHE